MSDKVERKHEIRDRLLEIATSPKYEGGRPNVDPDDEELLAFLEKALEEVVEMLAENRAKDRNNTRTLVGGPTVEDYGAVDELLASDNIEEIQVHERRLHAPKVQVWLKSSAVRGNRWANSADREEFHWSQHRKHHNGKPVMAVLDVRPF